jgi:ATP-dependent Clp protease, protease subunit
MAPPEVISPDANPRRGAPRTVLASKDRNEGGSVSGDDLPRPPTAADGFESRRIEDELHEQGVVMIGAAIDDPLANRVVAQLLDLDADHPDREITMLVNSAGGSIPAMSAIYDTMTHIRPDVRTRCMGRADSVAAVLLAAGTPGKRQIAPTATVVIRQPRSHEVRGDATDLEIEAVEANRRREVIERVLAKHTGKPAEQIHQDIERALVLTAEEAVRYGLADEVAQRRTTQRE